MRDDETLLLRLAEEIATETDSLAELRVEFVNAPKIGANTYEFRARASILHDFYTGVERVFVRIAEELNGGVPRSERWHSQLLTDMTLRLDSIRPPVITKNLAGKLGLYLRFRHLFRNLYGYTLDPARIAPLEANFDEVFERFMTEIQVFTEWLRASD